MSLGAVILALLLLAAGVPAQAQDRPADNPRPRAEERRASEPRRSPPAAPTQTRGEQTRPQAPGAGNRARTEQPRGPARPASPAPGATPAPQADQPAAAAPGPGDSSPAAVGTAPRPTTPAPGGPPPPGGSVADALSGRDTYHGNFCGTARKVGVLEPIDELDAACKRHDDCYDISGHRSCTCDRELKREALAIANGAQFSRDIRARAATIAQAAELMSCVGP